MDGTSSSDSQFHFQSGFRQSNLRERLISQQSAVHLAASDRVASNFDPPREGLTLLPILWHQTKSLRSRDGRDAVSGLIMNQPPRRFLSPAAIDQTHGNNLDLKVRIERDEMGIMNKIHEH
jgi:hypothetical protein